jgi:hypothetical protein
MGVTMRWCVAGLMAMLMADLLSSAFAEEARQTDRRVPRQIQRPLCDFGWVYTALGCSRLTAGVDVKAAHGSATLTNTFARTSGTTSFDSSSDSDTKWGGGLDIRGELQVTRYARAFAGAWNMFSGRQSYFATRQYAPGDLYSTSVSVTPNVFTGYGGGGILISGGYYGYGDIYINLYGGARATTIDATLAGQAVNPYGVSDKETKWVGMGAVELSFESRGTSLFILPPGSIVRTGVQFQGGSSTTLTTGTPFAQSTSSIDVKNTQTYYFMLAYPIFGANTR